MKWRAIISLLCLFLFAFTYKELRFKTPAHFPKPLYNFERNALSKEKIELGKALFYEPMLSGNNTISCESCHSPYSAFTHVDHALSHGINDSIGKRNAQALFNLAWQPYFMWDGVINNLDVQALAPISHAGEMGSSIIEVLEKLRASKKYKALFFAAYKDSVANSERLLKSLSQFMLSLVSANSKYDKMLRKETIFTEQENRGYVLFQKHCSTCHAEPLLSTYAFEYNALPVETTLKDVGRMRVTNIKADSLKFKVPSIRNVAYTYPYMHDGRFKKLSEVLTHYNTAISTSKELAKKMARDLPFSADEKVEIISFLLTTSDPSFIFNPTNRPKK